MVAAQVSEARRIYGFFMGFSRRRGGGSGVETGFHACAAKAPKTTRALTGRIGHARAPLEEPREARGAIETALEGRVAAQP